jgi:hypothetical protein
MKKGTESPCFDDILSAYRWEGVDMDIHDLTHSLLGLAIIALVIAISIFPLWRIIARTGHNPALSLFGIVPLFGLILLWWLAFAEWPNHPTANG